MFLPASVLLVLDEYIWSLFF